MAEPGRFAAALARGPLLLDAAMGTRLLARGLDLRVADTASWTLSHPEVVLEIHRLDVAAGADAVLTNTFSAHPSGGPLGRPLAEMTEICRHAAGLAREAVGPSGFVVGCLGPRDCRGPEDHRAADSYREQGEALADAGADALLLETFLAAPAAVALARLRRATDLPVLVSLWRVDREDLESGRVRRLADLGATALGCNCTADLDGATAILGLLDGYPALPLLAKPGGGLPGASPIGPETFAEAVPAWIAMGVRLFGGCCGTTEAHLIALRRALDGQ